ncbi:signal recognition particle-docking protein FtsY [Spiroplasma endosymbiont of 'Nebria riversi']|uniref:signal recognition particle-docking protein FtsY n=1 Tax=Spiroplasma endosymbiont of 'Nebria riversi' TaxID=2792084 RepID=UPI001C03D8D0|nr:signal recognition particle-docking protein FtsY [Spiroplasma endosymbiont of 'Nebria riversi']
MLKKLKDKILSKSSLKYKKGLNKSRKSFLQKLQILVTKHRVIDETYFEELENTLILADVGVKMALQIVNEIKNEVRINNIKDPEIINELIIDKMFAIYASNSFITTTLNVLDNQLNVILVVGVNGAGKTTSIAKLAYLLLQQNKKVLLVAGDTFRAGAVEQLSQWAKRLQVPIVVPSKEQQDPASVIYTGIKKGQELEVDVVLCDSAGRLQTKTNLMNELNKIYKVIQKVIIDAPHETLLVVDATTGQNGVSQAQNFTEVAPVTGIILTKMDGSSKGGIILAIKESLNIPVKYIGLGEKLDDLEEFDLEQYIQGLTTKEVTSR